MEQKMKLNKKDVISILLNNKAFFLVILLCIVALFFSSKFYMPQNLINVLRQVCAAVILGIGFTYVLASGGIDLSVGSMLGLLGVIMAKISLIEGVSFSFVLLAGLLAGAILGLINGTFITAFSLPPFIVTVATGQLCRGFNYLLCNNTPISGLPMEFKFIGQGYIGPLPVPVYMLLVVTILGAILLYRTVLGRQLVAIGGNPVAAKVCGVNINRVKIKVYIIMGLCTAISSMVLTGRSFSAQPTAGQGMELDVIAAVVIGGTSVNGGTGKIAGTIFGCLIVGIINNVLNLAAIDSNWQLIVRGLIILFAIILDSQSEKVFANIRKQY